jgi:tetratricopeptide (TPR) repeat protein
VAGREDREPRTVLEHLIWQQDRTYEEAAAHFVVTARSMNERATISARHLARLARGERGSARTTPATRRVLQRMFARSADDLLRPWAQSPEVIDAQPDAEFSQRLPSRPGDLRRLLTMAAKRARRFTLTAGQGGTTTEVVDQLREDTQRLAVAYPQQPLMEVLSDLVALQDTVFALLEQRQRPQQARDLYFLGGIVAGLLAKASHDLADPHSAMAQARTAFLCADTAEHDSARAWLRGLQSLIAYWAGRHQEAVRYAQAGSEYAARSRNTTAVWLPMNEARAWAALGNDEQARLAIDRAERAWDDIQTDELDELGGLCTFFRERQLYYAADALAWLPEHTTTAERYSEEAVTAYRDPGSAAWAFGDQAGSHTNLAVALVKRGEFEGAAETLAPVLDLPAGQRINGIVHSLQRVHGAIRRAPLTPVGQDLLDQIETFGRAPAVALSR